VQVVIALVVTPEGLPLAYEVLAGNTADNTTLRDFLARIVAGAVVAGSTPRGGREAPAPGTGNSMSTRRAGIGWPRNGPFGGGSSSDYGHASSNSRR
jgi:hypothetical protein